MKRKIEITAIEQVRIRGTLGQEFCPVCQKFTEYLTSAKPARTARVKTESVRCWLAEYACPSPLKTVPSRRIYGQILLVHSILIAAQMAQKEVAHFLKNLARR